MDLKDEDTEKCRSTKKDCFPFQKCRSSKKTTSPTVPRRNRIYASGRVDAPTCPFWKRSPMQNPSFVLCKLCARTLSRHPPPRWWCFEVKTTLHLSSCILLSHISNHSHSTFPPPSARFRHILWHFPQGHYRCQPQIVCFGRYGMEANGTNHVKWWVFFTGIDQWHDIRLRHRYHVH